MGKWVEQEGSPDFQDGPGSARTLTRVFCTDANSGYTEALSRKFIKDVHTFSWNGIQLYLKSAGVLQNAAYDKVTLKWTDSTDAADVRFNQGVTRKEGEEEWEVQPCMKSETITDKTVELNTGKPFSEWGSTTEYKLGDQIMMPSVTLIWRKWIKFPFKNITIDATKGARMLPKTKAQAMNVLQTYMPGGWEGSANPNLVEYGEKAGPRIGMLLAESAEFPGHLLCVSISLEADGPMVCRTATYEWTNRPSGWSVPPYFVPS